MKKGVKAFVCTVLAACLCGLPSCDKKKGSPENEVEVFSTYSTDKVLRDVAADDALKMQAAFAVTAARGETEDAQIVLRPTQDVQSCTVTLGKIALADGTEFPADNLTLYYQKYIEITSRTKGYTDNPYGFYPDILLPYETAVAYKENIITAGENQAIVLSATVDAAQKAGVYTGTAAIDLDGKTISVAVTIDVRDVTLPAQKHLLTDFNTDYSLVIDGELNDTQEMHEAYCDTLLAYNVTPRQLPRSTVSGEMFKTQLRKYYDKVSSYEIPAEQSSTWKDGLLRQSLIAVAEASLEDGRNYFEKARYWLYSVDEPVQTNRTELAVQRINTFHDIIDSVANEVESWELPDNGEITKSMLANAMRGAKALVTSDYTELIPNMDIWCPMVAKLQYSSQREYYEQEWGKEYWVYTLNTSLAPQPNHHIDNPNGLNSSRVLGWMCRDYGISGRLYYQTCFQQKTSYVGGFHYEKCDPYTETMRYPEYNGDGFLLYPGAKYGIFGPIASNRLVAIRDSVDDYELLYTLEQKYTEAGYDAAPILQVLYDSLYAGVNVSADGAALFAAREQIFNLHALADKGVYVRDCQKTAEGYAMCVAGDNAAVTVNGQNVNDDAFAVALTQKANTVSIEKEGVRFIFAVGGKKSVVLDYNADNQAKGVADSSIYTHTVVNGAEIGVQGNVEKVEFSGERKNVYIRPAGIGNLLTANTRELCLTVYNPTDTVVQATVYVEGDVEYPVDICNVKPGKNTIVLKGIDRINWKSVKKATGIQIMADKANTLNALYIGEIYITEVVA